MQDDTAAQAEALEFDALFSTRKPRDVKAGLASGAKSVLKGVAAGAIGLIAAPAIGASQEGVKGFCKGAAAGVAGAVLLPVTGVVVGAVQVGRGAINQPEAIKQQQQGKVWDEASRRWIEPPGLALVPDGADQRRARAAWRRRQRGGAGGASGADEGEDLYELLGVAPDASPEEIKRQYYLLARRTHPDKNPDDPQAKEKFQRLGEAFQVLGNPELRKRYDEHGAQGLDVNFVDGAEFFSALFGSDRFEHLVGELALAAAARSGGDLSAAQLKRMQHEREAQLAVLLGALLRRYVEGDAEGFRESMAAEAAELATASFGDRMLGAIGGTYKAQADIHLGGVLDGSLAALKAKGQGIKAQFSAASLAIKVFKRQQEIAKLDAIEQQARAAARQQAEAEAGSEHAAAAAGEAEWRQQGQQQQQGQDEQQQQQEGQQRGAAPPGAAAPADQQAADAAAAALAATAAAAERARLEEQSLPLMLDAMWAANRLDIEATLRHVCRRLLQDEAASKAHRRLRAEALRELGSIFLQAARTAADDKAARLGSGGAGASSAGGGSQRPSSAGSDGAEGSGGVGGSRGGAEARRRQREEEERRRAEGQQRLAKRQMEEAMLAVMRRRMGQEDGPA